MPARSIRVLALGPLLALGASACASTGTTSGATDARRASISPLTPTSRLIDGQRIARSGAQTALDAIRAFVPNSRLNPIPPGSMPWLNTPAMSRGIPRILVDGHLIGDVESLRMIPAHEVLAIHILSAADASIRFGPQYDSGVIVVQTRAALRRL